jgi:hypothetical protein
MQKKKEKRADKHGEEGYPRFHTPIYRWESILDFISLISDIRHCAFQSDIGSFRYQTELWYQISDCLIRYILAISENPIPSFQNNIQVGMIPSIQNNRHLGTIPTTRTIQTHPTYVCGGICTRDTVPTDRLIVQISDIICRLVWYRYARIADCVPSWALIPPPFPSQLCAFPQNPPPPPGGLARCIFGSWPTGFGDARSLTSSIPAPLWGGRG